MRRNLLTIFLVFYICYTSIAQDTFSIVAVDSTTGEVGSAGASCVDLLLTSFPNDDFLSQLVPNVGAINTQAYYNGINQVNATERMNLGDTPEQIINWLIANDIDATPNFRQYGIAALVNGAPMTAAYTGVATDDYKGHILGSNYAIQGNILLGRQVLDSMESRFLSEPGDLACKLMAALQGAKMVGADARCSENGTSSLFAFVKVSKPEDEFGKPSFIVSVRTRDGARIEPIDSLQRKFNLVHSCQSLKEKYADDFSTVLTIYPNPVSSDLMIEKNQDSPGQLFLYDLAGHQILSETINKKKEISVSNYNPGIYFLKVKTGQHTLVKKIIIN